MAHFDIGLLSFQIFNRRTNHPFPGSADTVKLSAALRVGNSVVGNLYLDKHSLSDCRLYGLGDLMIFKAIEVTDPDVEIVFSYIIVNAGNTDVQSALVDGATQLAQLGTDTFKNAVESGNIIEAAIGLGALAIGELAGLEFANCDGVVAADQISCRFDYLEYITKVGPWSGTRRYPGTNSPDGCGSNSDYGASFSFSCSQKDSWRVITRGAVANQPFGGWSEVQGGGRTNRAVAATAFHDRLFIYGKGVDDDGVYQNSAAAGHGYDGWISVQGNGRTVAALAATTFADRVYLAAKQADNMLYVTSAGFDEGFNGWSQVPSGGSLFAPTLAVYNTKLYLLAVGMNSKIYICSANAGEPFNGWVEIPSGGTPHSVAACSFGDRLFVVASGFDSKVYITNLQGDTFQGWSEVQGKGETDRAVGITVFDNRLFLAKRARNGSVSVTSAAFGEGFNGWSDVPDASTLDTPTLAALDAGLYLFCVLP